jgi:hypothetical protein
MIFQLYPPAPAGKLLDMVSELSRRQLKPIDGTFFLEEIARLVSVLWHWNATGLPDRRRMSWMRDLRDPGV